MAGSISDEAVRERTGKTWAEWFSILDGASAATMNHDEIAALLKERKGLDGWWSQMVAVHYERARGLRPAPRTRR